MLSRPVAVHVLTNHKGKKGSLMASPAPRDVWHRVAQSDPDALVSQSPEWIDAMVATGHWRDASRWYVASDGRELVMPMARQRIGGLLGFHSSFGDGWGFGGLLAQGGVKSGDVELVLDDLARQRAVQTSIRINPLHADRWAQAAAGSSIISTPRCACVLDLSGGADEVWKERMTAKGRAAVRRARKRGVEVECDTTGAQLPVFYELLLKSFDRWAAQQHEPLWMARMRGRRRDPLRKFEVLADRIGPAFRLYIARYEGCPAAAVLVLAGANAHFTRGAMDPSVLGNTRANELLMWSAIEDACRAGCTSFHMGETAPGSSLARYKEKFGAVAVPYAEYVLERLPITRWDTVLRGVVKRVIGFREA
jgi:CelD/BcsL family acetyltransferase involved in cellulose biosynthesis